MIASVRFENFKVLRDATLPLSPLTLIIGPNGSGKSTALQAMKLAGSHEGVTWRELVTAGEPAERKAKVRLQVKWGRPLGGLEGTWLVPAGASGLYPLQLEPGHALDPRLESPLLALHRMRIYTLDAREIARQVPLDPQMTLDETGFGLAVVLDRLRDQAPEAFEELNEELPRWVPEFDRVLFDTPQHGTRSFLLRTRQGRHTIPARHLSEGTLFALVIMALAHSPLTPPLIAIEGPEHGMHPRLLRDVFDALYRASHPQEFGLSRPPKQVVVTTHSPYLLDLFRDRPEYVVIAQKAGSYAEFESLAARKDLDDILGDAPLGEAWYTGILGGVPAKQ